MGDHRILSFRIKPLCSRKKLLIHPQQCSSLPPASSIKSLLNHVSITHELCVGLGGSGNIAEVGNLTRQCGRRGGKGHTQSQKSSAPHCQQMYCFLPISGAGRGLKSPPSHKELMHEDETEFPGG